MEIEASPAEVIDLTINTAANNPLKLIALGWLAAHPEVPVTATELGRTINILQGDYPGLVLSHRDKNLGAAGGYCESVFKPAGLVHKVEKSSAGRPRPVTAYAGVRHISQLVLAASGACMDWELTHPDYNLQDILGARSRGKGTQGQDPATARLTIYQQILESPNGIATSAALAQELGWPAKAVRGLISQLNDAGITQTTNEYYNFGKRGISLLGFPADFVPLRPNEYEEIKALYALFTELYVREKRVMDGRFLLNALAVRRPDIDTRRARHLLLVRFDQKFRSWKSFMHIESTADNALLRQNHISLTEEYRDPIADLVERYKGLHQRKDAWAERATDILDDKGSVAELMEKYAELAKRRDTAAIPQKGWDTFIAGIISSGGMRLSDIRAEVRRRSGKDISRLELRSIIMRSPYFIYKTRPVTGRVGAHWEAFVHLAGAPEAAGRKAPTRPPKKPTSSWRDEALCARTDPEIFFPQDKPPPTAEATCAECPVAGPCLDFAAASNQNHGLWAGLSGQQVKLYRSKLPYWLPSELAGRPAITNTALVSKLYSSSES